MKEKRSTHAFLVFALCCVTVVFEIRADIVCLKGWTLYNRNNNNKCIHLSTVYKVYADARNACKAKGGDLLRVDSEDESKFLKENFPITPFRIWIGLNDLKREGQFVWGDETARPRYTKWAPNEPNDAGGTGQNCVHISWGNLWDDNYCWKSYRYLCQKAAQDVGCTGTFDAIQGSIVSPNYPSPYPGDLDCRWEIDPPLGSNITLQFNPQFELEDDIDCAFDYVQVSRGDGVIGQWCGSKAPPPIMSYGEKLVVVLKTDDENTGKGFRADWDITKKN